MAFKVKSSKEIIWKKGIEHRTHSVIGIPVILAKRMESFDSHHFAMALDSMLIPWLRMNDKPMEITIIPCWSYSIF
jgi:hypothetical protein